jgi:hypothetical protein
MGKKRVWVLTYVELLHSLGEGDHLGGAAGVLDDRVLERCLQFQGGRAVHHDGDLLLQEGAVLRADAQAVGGQVAGDGHHLGGGAGTLVANSLKHLQHATRTLKFHSLVNFTETSIYV